MLAARRGIGTVRSVVAVSRRRMFEEFAETTAKRAPLYSALSRGVAADPTLMAVLDAAPPTQRLPVSLFAAVQFVLLADTGEPLAAWYPNLSPTPRTDDALPALRDLCRRRRVELTRLLATRRVQTNEVGRCALFLPVFGLLAAEVGPLAHVDVGTSAGLNLLLAEYSYRYEPGGELPAGPVELVCGIRGDAPIPRHTPSVAAAAGLDLGPIDVLDDDATRWLEACVWPDQADRLARLRGAMSLARTRARAGRLDVRIGDAVTDTADLIGEIADASGAHPVVTNSWVLSYLTTGQRAAYVAALDAVGANRDLSWVYAESPALVEGVPRPPSPIDETVLSLVRWRAGVRTVEHLARCHPHGYWMHWDRRPMAEAT
ncbi:MAG: DUF2332 domain-containing protein [Desertimonas sp.]